MWIDGDYLTDTVAVAGSFADGLPLPTTPAAVAPGGSATLGTSCFFPNLRFDATASKIAFPANLIDPAQFDLFVADVNGLNATRLVATGPGVEVACVALSPDGSKVAFTMDSAAQDGLYDVYVVDTTGTGTPVRVSPGYPMDGGYRHGFFSQLTWSADSRYLGFTGEFANGIGAYVSDTSSAPATTVSLYSDTEVAYTASRLLFDATDHVYLRWFQQSGALVLYIADPGGQNRRVVPMPLRSDGTSANAGIASISPDGATIVFAADAPTQGTYELFTSGTAAWDPVAVTANSPTGTGYPAFYEPRFAPDGATIAVAAATSTSVEIGLAPLDGSARSRLYSLVAGESLYALSDWTLDGTGLYISTDIDGSGHGSLYRLDTHRVDQTPELAVAPPANGDVYNALIRPM